MKGCFLLLLKIIFVLLFFVGIVFVAITFADFGQ